MKFKELLDETPHVFIMNKDGEDVYIDFKREFGIRWIKVLLNIFKANKLHGKSISVKEKKEIIKNLKSDMFFKMALKTDYKELDSKEQLKLNNVLPKEILEHVQLKEK